MQSNGGEDGEGQLNDDFLEQMLSSWPEPKSPWDIAGGSGDVQKLFSLALAGKSPEDPNPFDDSSSLLASRIRHQQIGAGLVPLPLCLGSIDSAAGGGGVDPLYNGSLQQCSAASHFQQQQGSAAAAAGYGGAPSAAPPRQRVRARRGQATDPHSIAERLRRERIAERMKALQELVPNANKTDKASMLDEIIDYVKFLQLQVKVLSMSRLGGAAAVAPLVADVSSQAGGGGSMAAASSSDNLAVTEHQVAKLMEEDMGSAMQYLQGKGLCLMPISLASAISTATCHPRSFIPAPPDGPTSPSMSVLTVQSAMANGVDATTKDAASISKP